MLLIRAARVAGLLAFASLMACDPPADGGDDGTPSIGPQGGLIEYDAAAFGTHPDASTSHDASAHHDSAPAVDAASTERCTGFATACFLETIATCSTSPGCSWGSSCEGSPNSCYSQFDSYSCGRIEGCYWSYTTSSCSGSGFSCSDFSSSISCDGQSGCIWSDGCEGAATPCELLSADRCLAQSGCHLE